MKNNLLTAFQTNWVSLLVSIAVIAILVLLARKRVSFGTRVFIAMGLGLLAGIAFNTFKLEYKSVSTIGTIYVNLIKMLVMPLVFVLVINSISSLTSMTHLRKLGVKTILWFLGTTGVAAIIGLLVALAVDPGNGFRPRCRRILKPEKFRRSLR